MKAGTTTCRFALRDPSHECRRRDGRLAFGFDECAAEQRAQVLEQGQTLREAEIAAAAAQRSVRWPT